MALLSEITSSLPLPTTTLLLSIILLLLITHQTYKTLTHPLHSIPGPFLARHTALYTHYLAYLGLESSYLHSLHATYGPVVRISPNEVLFQEGEALAPIYTEKGGMRKAGCYRNFDSEGVETIFSVLEPEVRGVRARAVGGLFSSGSLKGGEGVIEDCVGGFVGVLRKGRERKGGKVDVLDLGRRLAVDVVCGYLFGENFGGLKEGKEEGLSVTGYVDSIVEVGRFFFLPPWLFEVVFAGYMWLWPGEKEVVEGSAEKVDSFINPLVQKAMKEEDDDEGTTTYQSRLLRAGISPHETSVQMKDVIFAGTDTTGMNLATIIFHLAKNPLCYEKLRAEVLEAEEKDPGYNPQSLPYLDAVIREGLRISLANATRFPRQVPPEGFTYLSPSTGKSYHLPSGTIVGLQPFTLHFNSEVFPDPHAFRPERWENATKEMHRDWIPFGLGPRRCIARNLAMVEMVYAVRGLAKNGVLEGAKVVQEKIEVLEWFNSKVIGGKVEIFWE